VDHQPLLGELSQAAQVTCRHAQTRADEWTALAQVSRRLVDTSLLPPNLERLGTSASIAGCRQEMAPRPEMSVDYKSLKCGTNRFAFENGQGAVFSSMSAAFSPIMIDGALVLPDVSVGMIEASAIRRPVMP
jgi:hypothetical protein